MTHAATQPSLVAPMCRKDPKISSTSTQDVHFELDALERIEFTQQSRWSLQFVNATMEKRFQLYHEEMSVKSSRTACAWTLFGLAVMQTRACYSIYFIRPKARESMSDSCLFMVYLGLAINGLVGLAWSAWCALDRDPKSLRRLEGKFQMILLVLGTCVVLVVLAQPAYCFQDAMSDRLEQSIHAHQLTRMVFFLLVSLSAMATIWNTQFLVFTSVAGFATLSMFAWFPSAAFYLRANWHVIVLFLLSLAMLGRSLYRSEYNLRARFLRLRQLMLENIKLTRQNSFMQQQLSSQVDSIGANDDARLASQREQDQAIMGESWMEKVLKTLQQLKIQLGDTENVGQQLDFVMQTLISEQDLFMGDRKKKHRLSQAPSQESGWLTLIKQQNYRRRKSYEVRTDNLVGKTLRRTSSGFQQTVLHQVETCLVASQRPIRDETNIQVPDSNSARASLVSNEEAAQKLLVQATHSEEFDLLEFSQSCAFPLTSILLTTLQSHNLFLELPLRVESTAEFALEIESRYHAKNPYHNAVHGASVVWDVNFLLRLLEQPATPLQVFSSLVAAAVHDVNHPGMNNTYLVNTNSPLAIKYSDDSVLERMHLAEAFQACTKDGCDIFDGFSKDLKRQCRKHIIMMVLATDLSTHLKHVNRLKSQRYAVHTACSDLTAVAIPPPCVLADDLLFPSIIMMADLGHAIKSFDYHFAWSKLVTEEFFRQGDSERQFGMPISPLCDRQTCSFERNQIGFLEFVVLPLYSAVKEVVELRNFDAVLDRIQQNTSIWKQKVEQLETRPTE